MSLHDQIMNLRMSDSESFKYVSVQERHIYKQGYQDAQKAAAELANASDARIAGLQDQINRDSEELRNLCQARDDARKERDAYKARVFELEQLLNGSERPAFREKMSKRQTEHELEAMKRYIEKITKDKDSAVGFLSRAGIIDGSGQLAEQYRNVEAALLKGQP